MAEAMLHSGHMAHNGDDILDITLAAEEESAVGDDPVAKQSLVGGADVDPDEFDFQLGSADGAEATEEHSSGYRPAADGAEVSEHNRAESEIGYEDEDAGLDAANEASSHVIGTEVADDDGNYEEITYEGDGEGDGEGKGEGEGNLAASVVSVANLPSLESTNPDQLAAPDNYDHGLEVEDQPEDLDFNPEIAPATGTTNQEAAEELQVHGDETLPAESAEPVREPEQTLYAEDGNDFDSGEQYSETRQHALPRPEVRIIYNDVSYELCAKEGNEDPDTFFFSGNAELDYSLSRFLSCLREVISDEVTDADELVIRVDGLGLEFGENSSETFLSTITFRDILELHDQLQQNDGATEYSAPVLELVTRPDCAHVFAELLDAANQGVGLSELLQDSKSEDSNVVSLMEEVAQYGDYYGGPVETKEPGFQEAESHPQTEQHLDGGDSAHTEDSFRGNAPTSYIDVVDDTAADEAMNAENDHSGNHRNHAEEDIDYEFIEGPEMGDGISQSDFPHVGVFTAEEEEQYGGGDVSDEYGHPRDGVAIGSSNVVDASTGDVDQASEEIENADGLGGEIEAAEAEVAAASLATGNEPISISPFNEKSKKRKRVDDSPGVPEDMLRLSSVNPVRKSRRLSDSLVQTGAHQASPALWSVYDDLIGYFDDEMPRVGTSSRDHSSPASRLKWMDDGLIDYSDDEEPVSGLVSDGLPRFPVPPIQSNGSGTNSGVNTAPVKDLLDIGSMLLSSPLHFSSPVAKFDITSKACLSFSSITDADLPDFKGPSESVTQVDSGLDITQGSVHETQHQYNEHDSSGKSEGLGVAEPSQQNNYAVAVGADVSQAPQSEASQAGRSSPTSTIKGDEITYDGQGDADDGFDFDLRETHSPSALPKQDLDEIDWDNDEDVNVEGIAEQDAQKLTSPNNSTKRSRMLFDSGSLADESDVKRRRT